MFDVIVSGMETNGSTRMNFFCSYIVNNRNRRLVLLVILSEFKEITFSDDFRVL